MGKYKRGTTLYDYCLLGGETWLLDQFDNEKNWPSTPHDYPKSSNERVWFTYPCGHSRKQRIADKTGKRSKGCPSCLNRGKIGKSLLEAHPYYAEMFLTEKNGVRAENVSQMNGNSYWWRCKQCGAEFKGKVSDVVLGHRVCGECSNQRRSFPEYCLGFYLLHLDEARVFDRSISGYRFDIFLPK